MTDRDERYWLKQFVSAAKALEANWESGDLAAMASDVIEIAEEVTSYLRETEPEEPEEGFRCPHCGHEDEVRLVDVLQRTLTISLDPRDNTWDVESERMILDSSTTVMIECPECDRPFDDSETSALNERYGLHVDFGLYEKLKDWLA